MPSYIFSIMPTLMEVPTIYFYFKTDSSITNLIVNKLSNEDINLNEYLSNFKLSFSTHEDLILLEEEIAVYKHKTHIIYLISLNIYI